MSEEQETETSWRDNVPEPLREFTVVKEAKDADGAYNSLAESLRYADKLRGSAVRLPSEEAGREDLDKFNKRILDHSNELMLRPDIDNQETMDSFYTSIGRPEEVDGYEIPEFDGDVNDEKIKGFRDVAHKAGLTKRQFNEVVSSVVGGDLQVAQEAQLAEDQVMNTLKEEWGAGFENQFNKAEFIRKEFFDGVIPEGKMPAEIIKRFNTIAKQLGSEGESLTARIPDNQGGGITRDEALSRAAEIKRTPAYKRGDPVAMKKHREYFQIAYPE